MMTVPAYQRRGCSQSGNRLIVCPHVRHRNRRTHMTIQLFSETPRTWREYMPWPTICNTPVAMFQAGWPQKEQCFRRRSSREGASALLAQSCSTVTAKLCRMTNSFLWGGGLGSVRQKNGPSRRLPPFSRSIILIKLCWDLQAPMRRNRAGLAGIKIQVSLNRNQAERIFSPGSMHRVTHGGQ